MVKVDIKPEEAQAYAELMKDAKCPPEMGYLLTSLKFKIFEAFKAAKAKEDRAEVYDTVKKLLEEEQKRPSKSKKE